MEKYKNSDHLSMMPDMPWSQGCSINPDTCLHDKTLVVIDTFATLEVTAIQCSICDKFLTEPKIEI